MPTDSTTRGWANVLAGVPLFAGLSKRQLNRVAALGKPRRFPRYTAVVRAGERGDAFFVILEGTVIVRPPGKRASRLHAGDWFGEMALLDGGPRAAGVEAETEVLLMAIGRPAFRKMIEADPKVAVGLLTTLAERLRAAERSPSRW